MRAMKSPIRALASLALIMARPFSNRTFGASERHVELFLEHIPSTNNSIAILETTISPQRNPTKNACNPPQALQPIHPRPTNPRLRPQRKQSHQTLPAPPTKEAPQDPIGQPQSLRSSRGNRDPIAIASARRRASTAPSAIVKSQDAGNTEPTSSYHRCQEQRYRGDSCEGARDAGAEILESEGRGEDSAAGASEGAIGQ